MISIGQFEIQKRDNAARRGIYHTYHGAFDTPNFMPVGTQGTVKGVSPEALESLGAQIVLSNTYHLHLRPGEDVINQLGGIHKFMSWPKAILTDSGGFQVFSLSKLRKVNEKGVSFQSHIDGSRLDLTPESVVQIQETLGVDIMMVLDECLAYPAQYTEAEASLNLTINWAKRAIAARKRPETLAFAILQGGMFPELRERCAQELCSLPYDGYAIGGLSVGEPLELMAEMTALSVKLLPDKNIHYLMGVGTPSDIVRSVGLGVDLFDCVIPTRSARFGRLYTETGFLNIRNSIYKTDPKPVLDNCDCYACRHFSRAYLAHLIRVHEALYVQLASIHNLRFYQRLMETIRSKIVAGEFSIFAKSFLANRNETNEIVCE
ncbi:MAG: tRNA guanosine(34) transglycosylase Tgt [Deltaproteobacteria bacterium]|nr:tRNA guanosine(34) transglycosylase Tgt [Deltaproteobacteria bacterium]